MKKNDEGQNWKKNQEKDRTSKKNNQNNEDQIK
jgi:hypothetical protein